MVEHTIAAIQEVLRILTPGQRQQIAAWIYGYTGQAHDIAEPGVGYGAIAAEGLPVEEYLRLERRSEIRHEYVAGDVFAMSAPSLRHEAIVMNLGRELSAHLRGGPCQAFVSNVKVHIQRAQNQFFYYPDAVVVCGPLDMGKHLIDNPRLIVEVLSPSTESTDRREKAQNYRSIASLEEYVLVSQYEPLITVQRRAENWLSRQISGLNTAAEFRSVALSVPLSSIYEGVAHWSFA